MSYRSYFARILAEIAAVYNLNNGEDILNAYFILTDNSRSLNEEKEVRPARKLSRLCWDGTPFEVSVVVSSRLSGLRYVIDGLDQALVVSEKAALASAAYEKVILLHNGYSKLPINYLLRPFISSSIQLPSKLDFVIWHGAEYTNDDTTLKAYINLKWLPKEMAWRHILAYVNDARPDAGSILHQGQLPFNHRVSFCGIESKDGTLSAIKIYLRLEHIQSDDLRHALTVFGITDYRVVYYLEKFIVKNARGIGGAVLSLRLPIGSGDLSIKIEVPCVQHFKSDLEAKVNLDSLANEIGLDTENYFRILDIICQKSISHTSVDVHTMIGLSTNDQENRSMNIYLKPNLWPHHV